VVCDLQSLYHVASSNAEIAQQLLRTFMDALVADSAALGALIHRGLSAEVQGAARAGSAPARQAMTAVCDLFHASALVLDNAVGIVGDDSCGGAEAGLRAFLNREETLPFLELLCLPLDGELASWLAGCRAAPAADAPIGGIPEWMRACASARCITCSRLMPWLTLMCACYKL
jgi:hypothetical protein